MVHMLKMNSQTQNTPVGDDVGSVFLPDYAHRFVHNRVAEIVGAVFMVIAAVIVATVFSYSPGDPSLNIATDNQAQNVFGAVGAAIADLILQTSGFAGVVPALIIFVWGYKMLRRKRLSVIGRHPAMVAIYMMMAVTLMSIMLAAITIPSNWPLVAGMGGLIGDLLFNQLTAQLAKMTVVVSNWVIVLVLPLPIMALFALAVGSTWQEWRDFTVDFFKGVKKLIQTIIIMGQYLKSAMSQISNRNVNERNDFERRNSRDEQDDDGRVSVRFGKKDSLDGADDDVKNQQENSRSGLVADAKTRLKKSKRAKAVVQGKLDLGPSDEYELPSLNLLEEFEPTAKASAIQKNALEQNAIYLGTVLADFGVKGEIVKVRPGPVVTLYELEPAPGTKTSRVIGLADDIARSMSAVSVRIAVVPGRSVIGIEMPNVTREMVSLREMLSSVEFEKTAAKLPLALGKDIGGVPMMADLARMPHLLIAGTTGSGKSVAMNTMILSLLYSRSPDECRLIMIDPKMLELSVYEGIPHLLTPVVTDPSKAVVALKWTVREMEDRYRAMSQLGVRNVGGYNKRILEAKKKGEVLTRKVQTGFDEKGLPVMEEQPLPTDPLPFIVVVVDEMADLMMVAGKDVEAAIQRLAQMARAAGIHLIMATQRPSVDVITGTIKANFPTRISFQVTSKIDSRTILGEQGAEQLLGQGDMLYMAGGGRISRIHGPFVSDEEVEDIVRHLKTQRRPDYVEDVTVDTESEEKNEFGVKEQACDVLYDEAVALVAREGKASTSFIQRHLQIGYNRAARIIENMEKQGVVSPANRVGRREVMVGEH